MTIDRTELRPCPFCSRTDLLGFEPYPESGFLGVRCRACGCIGKAGRGIPGERPAEAEAAAHWNNQRALDAKDRRIAELEADVVAADERMAGVLDGTFSVGDGTAQAEIERCRARIAELEHIEAAYERLRDELGGANASLLAAGRRIADLELRLSIATELNVGDRKRIAELEALNAAAARAVDVMDDIGEQARARIKALETALTDAINWIADRSSPDSVLVGRLRKLLPSEGQ